MNGKITLLKAWAVIGPILAFILGIIPQWTILIHEYTKPIFVSRIINSATAQTGTPLIKFNRDEDGWARQPISMALKLELTNISSDSLRVDGYILEFSANGSDWTSLPRIQVLDPRCVEYEKEPRPVHFDLSKDGFDILAAASPLDAGHTWSAWIFVGGPDWVNPKDQNVSFRLTIFDSQMRTEKVKLEKISDASAFITSAGLTPLSGWIAPWDRKKN